MPAEARRPIGPGVAARRSARRFRPARSNWGRAAVRRGWARPSRATGPAPGHRRRPRRPMSPARPRPTLEPTARRSPSGNDTRAWSWRIESAGPGPASDESDVLVEEDRVAVGVDDDEAPRPGTSLIDLVLADQPSAPKKLNSSLPSTSRGQISFRTSARYALYRPSSARPSWRPISSAPSGRAGRDACLDLGDRRVASLDPVVGHLGPVDHGLVADGGQIAHRSRGGRASDGHDGIPWRIRVEVRKLETHLGAAVRRRRVVGRQKLVRLLSDGHVGRREVPERRLGWIERRHERLDLGEVLGEPCRTGGRQRRAVARGLGRSGRGGGGGSGGLTGARRRGRRWRARPGRRPTRRGAPRRSATPHQHDHHERKQPAHRRTSPIRPPAMATRPRRVRGDGNGGRAAAVAIGSPSERSSNLRPPLATER